ncbi:MAG: DUF4421 family protein [Paludibacteraceae bacterium]|nr:DUF4421 family protein [Paludibacteraceae bacterium]
MHRTRIHILLLLSLLCLCAQAKPTKGLLFFYRTGNWVDNYLRKGIDTSYIDLPEHSWRIAYTNAMVGVNSNLTSTTPDIPDYGTLTFTLLNKTTPSVDLGFYAAYRGFGFGYSWDAIHAYAQRLSFSFGSKFIGIDFGIQTSTNIHTNVLLNGQALWNQGNAGVIITNASLNLWYALNAAHYSHQAAVKQSYIQKKTAGSLLLHLSYLSSQVDFSDTIKVPEAQKPLLPALMSNLTAVRTRQVAVGIGYGINYTPNHGKVVLHLSAAAMLVTYSVNLASYYLPDSIAKDLPGQPMYNLPPAYPVHVSGNMRAAVSWEINKWVHLNVWATAENIRFRSKPTVNYNTISLENWDWKVQASVGVRLGAGKDRLQRALEEHSAVSIQPSEGSIQTSEEPKKSRYPLWLTDYFWSPKN